LGLGVLLRAAETLVQLEQERNGQNADRFKEQPAPLQNCFAILAKSSRLQLESSETGRCVVEKG